MGILSLLSKNEQNKKDTNPIINTVFAFSLLTGVALAGEQNATGENNNTLDSNKSSTKEIKNAQKSAAELVDALIGEIKKNKVEEEKKLDLFYISKPSDLGNLPSDKEITLIFDSKEVSSTTFLSKHLPKQYNKVLVDGVEFNRSFINGKFYDKAGNQARITNETKIKAFPPKAGDIYYLATKKDLRNMPFGVEFDLDFSSKKSLNNIFAKDLGKEVKEIMINGEKYNRGKGGKFYREGDNKIAKLLNGTKLEILNPQNLAIREENKAILRNQNTSRELDKSEISKEYMDSIFSNMIGEKINDKNDGSGYYIRMLQKIGALESSKGINAHNAFYNFNKDISTDISSIAPGKTIFLPATENKRQEIIYVKDILEKDENGNPTKLSIFKDTENGVSSEEKTLSQIWGKGKRTMYIGNPNLDNFYEENLDKFVKFSKIVFTQDKFEESLSKYTGKKYKYGKFDCSMFFTLAFRDLGILTENERLTAKQFFDKYSDYVKKKSSEIDAGDILFTHNKKTNHIAFVQEVVSRDEKGKPLIIKIAENTRKYGSKVGKLVHFDKFAKGRKLKIAKLKLLEEKEKNINYDVYSYIPQIVSRTGFLLRYPNLNLEQILKQENIKFYTSQLKI